MPYDKIQVANEALSLIEANLIHSFDDGTNEADTVNLWYDSFIAEIFSNNYWRFSIKTKALSQDADYQEPLLTYKKAFIVPPDCEVILGCYLPDSDRPFKLWTRTGVHILTNVDEIIAQYTTYPAESTWPGYFKAFAATALAAKIATEITGSQDKAKNMYELAYGDGNMGGKGGKWAEAASRDAMAYPKFETLANELVAARFS